mgnify:CR=1 FL=1
MTVINTNVAALTARTYAVQANEKMQQSMERLSSGRRINSAADDAAGMAVSNKMESQLRGMNVAIRNSQDGISLVQTAEAGMSEITNMIIRMRELSVQMNNGVYTNSDRANAQLEIDALLAEIDKIATNTAFNDVKVLDGSYDTDIRAGNTNPENIKVAVTSQKTTALGSTTKSSLDASTVATVSTADPAAVNQVSTRDMEALESTEVRVGLSTAAEAYRTATGSYTTTTTTTSAAHGTNNRTFSWDGSNNYIISSGQVDFDTSSSPDNEVDIITTIERRLNARNDVLGSAVTSSENSATNVITSSVNVEESDVTSGIGFTIAQSTGMGSRLSDAGTASNGEYYVATGTINSGSIDNKLSMATDGKLSFTGATNFDDNTAANNVASVAIKVYDIDSSAPETIANSVGTFTDNTNLTGNSITYTLGAQSNDDYSITLNSALATAANTATGTTLVSGDWSLSGSVSSTGDTTLASKVTVNSDGSIDIDDIGALTTDSVITLTLNGVDPGDSDTFVATVTINIDKAVQRAEENMTINITKSDSWKETTTLEIKKNAFYLTDVDVSTSSGAASAVTILDKALDEISSSQAKLGAIQNRLQHNIDNLSNGSRLTETARGRIVDADFARETSELSKQQILGQAATSMLAQANQSKQSVLALLQ